ncbi:MAG: hypothetical protein NT080_09120 [Spirochaetes bacterium]|nr:hypothetical protein [Spirochaetota bacterium]
MLSHLRAKFQYPFFALVGVFGLFVAVSGASSDPNKSPESTPAAVAAPLSAEDEAAIRAAVELRSGDRAAFMALLDRSDPEFVLEQSHGSTVACPPG